MSGGCGCTRERCGCCDGTRDLTPVSIDNRPGLDAIRYRAGTHGSFFHTMKADFGGMIVDAPGADGQTIEEFRPLTGLTTRATSDPSIALLDGWASIGDVLTFYQERIANEGYLRTATERRSVLELGRLIGYEPRPGVAATAYLAFTIDANQAEEVVIPVGTRSQTIPGPDELPQSFETSDATAARAAWNNLQVRLTQPQNITLATAMLEERVYVAGIATHLKQGDPLLLAFGDDGYPGVMRIVRAVDADFDAKRTVIALQAVPTIVLKALVILQRLVTALRALADDVTDIIASATALRDEIYLGNYPDFTRWGVAFRRGAAGGGPAAAAISEFVAEMKVLVGSPAEPPVDALEPTNPSRFAMSLLQPPNPQARSSVALGRTLERSFRKGADVSPQLSIQFAPRLRDEFYAAWSHATVSPAIPELNGIYALRVQASRFGASVPKQPTYYEDSGGGHSKGELKLQKDWDEWILDSESTNTFFLDQAYPAILSGSLIVVQTGEGTADREVRQVLQADTVQHYAYGLSAKSTRLALSESKRGVTFDSMDTLRATLIYAQSDKLTLANEPLASDVVGGSELPLEGLYAELVSGRWVIISGERADIPQVTGVRASELLMISGLRQDYDRTVPGDTTRTTLLLATPTAYQYHRSTVTIFGNVVKATHGESRTETLGAGDGAKVFQTFALKQAPLTFVAAPNPSGVDSTLKVYVNDVEWHEADSLAGLGPRDRKFITRTNDDGATSVVFGNGKAGARLPTGLQNVKARYRNGIGAPGNARAEQISLLQTRPLGVKGVVNPIRASGGADRETRDQARVNAPLAVMSLDRLVSVADYGDFTRTFAGIGKALAKKVSDGRRQLVQVTIAGADDIPIDPISDLYQNLGLALEELCDADLAIQVDSRELKALVLRANVRIDPDYLWDVVSAALRATLLDAFGFARSELARPVSLSNVVSKMQRIPGVLYVDVDAFGGVPERVADSETGERTLLTLDQISDAVASIASQTKPAGRVDVNSAGIEVGRVRPAQLAFFSPAVPDTLILNQIP